MISNPGSTQSADLMNKSTYDTTGKNTDIFEYVDTKTSDKVTASQVSTQIANSTSSFATTSYVDTEIAKVKDRFQWRHVDIIPYDGTLHTITANSSGVSQVNDDGDMYYYYLISLPFPINLQLYNYEIYTICVGKKCYKTSNPTSTSIPAGEDELRFFYSADLLQDKNKISSIYPNGNLFSAEPSEYRYYQTHGYTSKARTSYMRYNYVSLGYDVNIHATADQAIKLGEKMYSNVGYTNLNCDKVGLYMGRTYSYGSSTVDEKLTWKAYQISFDYRAIT